MNRATREAILRGVGAAAETHDAFRFQERLDDGLRPIDVFALIEDLQIPLRFGALDALLGACIRVSSAEVGILVTTQRDLHMQRFTAAHELGHFVLEHHADSLDREVRLPGNTDGRDHIEIEADAFAAEFLMPKWLVKAAAERRGWWAADALRDPGVVYQLSLRLAASYEATCWGLASHAYIDRASAEALIGNGRRLQGIKRRALDGVPMEDSWADVWVLDASDDGARIDAGPKDVFLLELEEPAAAGFRWDLERVLNAGFVVLRDESTFDATITGGPSCRRLALRAPPAGEYDLRLALRRSFSGAGHKKEICLSVSTVGARGSSDLGEGAYAPPTMH
jgi:predicted secreted protein